MLLRHFRRVRLMTAISLPACAIGTGSPRYLLRGSHLRPVKICNRRLHSPSWNDRYISHAKKFQIISSFGTQTTGCDSIVLLVWCLMKQKTYLLFLCCLDRKCVFTHSLYQNYLETQVFFVPKLPLNKCST